MEILLVVLTCFYRVSNGAFSRKSPISTERKGQLKPGKLMDLTGHTVSGIEGSLHFHRNSNLASAGPFY